MDKTAIEKAAELLAAARTSGRKTDGLPAALRPTSDEDSFAIQEAVTRRLGATIGAWKVGVPGGTAPNSYAPIYAPDVLTGNQHFAADKVTLRGVEGEIAIKLGKDLPARDKEYSRAEVEAAIASVHAVIEVVDSRYSDFAAANYHEKLADNVSNGALVLGPAVTDWQKLNLGAVPVTFTIAGTVQTEKVGGVPGGDPVNSLTWLANRLRTRGGMKAGQVVTTGSCTGLPFAKAGDTVTTKFEGLGEVSVSFAK